MPNYNIHIEDPYLISKRDFEKVIRSRSMWWERKVTELRSMRSLCREWAVHNFLYQLGICRSRTGSVDLNYPQKWWAEVGYFLLGWCRIFIK